MSCQEKEEATKDGTEMSIDNSNFGIAMSIDGQGATLHCNCN